jgi:hypothetical protein
LAVVAVAGLAVALLMLLWAAISGPGEVVAGGPHAQTAVPTATATVTTPEGQRSPSQRQPPPRSGSGLDLSWLGELVEAALLLGAGWLAWVGVRAVRDRMLEREHPTRIAARFDVVPDPVAVAERVASDREEHLGRLAEGSPRNGIVRCWVLFEDEAVELGVGPSPSETATEFLTRFLHRLDVDPRPAGRLAQLYHEARFSTHELTEAHREAAREALLSLHQDLTMAAPGRASVGGGAGRGWE